jgi:Rod binding domain-containing protein
MEAPHLQFNAADPLLWKERVLSDHRSEEAKLASASAQFEAILLKQFLSEALKPLTESGDTFGGKNPVYGYFITDTLATSLSESGAFGYSSLIQAQLADQTNASNETTDDNL